MNPRPSPPTDLSALSGCAEGLARAFVTLSSDIALVIDDDGIVTAVAQSENAPMEPGAQSWIGRAWSETVTGDTRGKIESLLADAGRSGLGRRREVNHGSVQGDSLPVAYTALRLGEHGPVLAVGRDLRSLAAIQQRFLDAQQALERSYWRARHDEVRYRLLYRVATDALATVDTRSGSFVALNPAAVLLLQADTPAQAGSALAPCFDARSRAAVAALLARAVDSAEPLEGHARLAGSHVNLSLVATRLAASKGGVVLLRLRRDDQSGDDPMAAGSALARRVDGSPEAIVVTDAEGRVREASLAFVQMAQAADVASVLGQPLEVWLPGTGRALVRSVQEAGLVPSRRVVMLRRDTTYLPVDLSGSLLADPGGNDAGFTLRPCDTDTLAADARAAALVKAIDALATELGSTTLPGLLQHAQALAQAHLVSTALDRHAGDGKAAAQLLGITPEQLEELRREPVRPSLTFAH